MSLQKRGAINNLHGKVNCGRRPLASVADASILTGDRPERCDGGVW